MTVSVHVLYYLTISLVLSSNQLMYVLSSKYSGHAQIQDTVYDIYFHPKQCFSLVRLLDIYKEGGWFMQGVVA